jgi:hypothetical protein
MKIKYFELAQPLDKPPLATCEVVGGGFFVECEELMLILYPQVIDC